MVDFPEFKPPFKKVLTDSEGNILVFTFHASDAGKPIYEGRFFDAYGPDGEFINTVEIEGKETPFVTTLSAGEGNEFWGMAPEDDFDLVAVRYKVH